MYKHSKEKQIFQRQREAEAVAAAKENEAESEETRRMVVEERRSWNAFELNIRNRNRMIEQVILVASAHLGSRPKRTSAGHSSLCLRHSDSFGASFDREGSLVRAMAIAAVMTDSCFLGDDRSTARDKASRFGELSSRAPRISRVFAETFEGIRSARYSLISRRELAKLAILPQFSWRSIQEPKREKRELLSATLF